MSEQEKLNVLEDMLIRSVKDAYGLTDVDADTFSEKFTEMFEAVREDCEQSSLVGYKEKASEVLLGLGSDTLAFEARNLERWRPSFDHLEMIWFVSQELGELHGKAIKAEGGDADDNTMAALAHIFPRALLVGQEIICLLKGGYPDGALARWRSLHELTCTAMYIAKHGDKLAEAYLLSFHFASRRAARQMNAYSDRANIENFSDDEMKEFDQRCSVAEQLLGRKIDKDKFGEWPAISQMHSNFADLEKDVGMDHWRPRYKWASTHTHANHRPMDKLLGMADSDVGAHLVGASNSGLVDLFQMTAITLAQITTTYLLHEPNVDRIVHSNVLLRLADEMSDIALENERVTREAFNAVDAK